MKQKLSAVWDVTAQSVCYTLLCYLLGSAMVSFQHSLVYILLLLLYSRITARYLQTLEKYIPRSLVRWLLLAVSLGASAAIAAAAGYLHMEFVHFAK